MDAESNTWSGGPVETLAIVAHPDDESLGCGGTLYLDAERGPTAVLVMSGKANARVARPTDSQLLDDFETAMAHLKVSHWTLCELPNIKFNTIPHLEVVQTIESAIRLYQPRRVICHHPNDLNDDHRTTARATLVAVRLPQRSTEIGRIEEVLAMETLSATDWSFGQSGPAFRPNYFVELGDEALRVKLEAIASYRGVMRPYPHPRSVEAITALAQYRGATAGLCNAEAFEVAMRLSTLKGDAE